MKLPTFSALTLAAVAALVVPVFGAEQEEPQTAKTADKALVTQQQPTRTTDASTASSAGQPSEEEMMKMMMENAKVNDHHKLLGDLVGEWTYAVKMWMSPDAPPMDSKGTAVRKAEMGGRYFVADASGKFAMPGPDGKMTDFDFKGHGTDAYDNAKQKFVSTWYDNMGTGIMMLEGTYDPASKTFTYQGDYDLAPGMKTKVRETIKIADKDHHTMEWFEDRGGKEVKTMEIAYTRKK